MIPKKNMAASVRQRLLNKARIDKRPFAELLQYYGMERFLYRLAQSKHAQAFVLKGALLLRTWGASMSRPTMDIDLLGRTPNEISAIKSQITDAIEIDLDDGLRFDTESVQVEQITEDAEYEGVRVRFLGHLGTARIAMQIDIGFGDAVFPEPTLVELPSILGSDHYSMLGYTRESAIAEKVDAMLRLGSINSRMKDFHDIWLLSRSFDYAGLVLSEALALTLETRGTDIPPTPAAFTTQFIDEKQNQWQAYLQRMSDTIAPSDFQLIISQTQAFVQPVLRNLVSSKPFNMTWIAPGPWHIT